MNTELLMYIKTNIFPKYERYYSHGMIHISIERRNKFEKDFFNKEYTKKVYENEFKKISSDGTIEKIKNYYLDY